MSTMVERPVSGASRVFKINFVVVLVMSIMAIAISAYTTYQTHELNQAVSREVGPPSEPAVHKIAPSKLTSAQQDQVEQAQSELDSRDGLSRIRLIQVLRDSDGMSESDAVMAADSVGANWNDQAVAFAQPYESITHLPCVNLTLQVGGSMVGAFTPSQTKYAVSQVGCHK